MVGVILLVARLLHAGVADRQHLRGDPGRDQDRSRAHRGVSQLPKLLGITGNPDASNFFGHMEGVFDQIGDTSVVTLVFSLATLAVLIGIKRFVPRVPGPLVAVVGGILLVAVGNIDEHGVALIAPVPSGLPSSDHARVRPHRGAAAWRVRDRHHGDARDPRRRPRGPSSFRARDRQRSGARRQRHLVRGGCVLQGDALGGRLLADGDQPELGCPHPAQ